jgi:hypothetical protein
MSKTGMFGEFEEKRLPPDVSRAVDEIADQAGFHDREPAVRPAKRVRGTSRALQSLTMKLHVADAERFIKWADAERLTYRDAFARLLASAKIGE